MSRINILSEQLTNMIAAGEVIERPLQVVKELVENSIDAHSHNITIELKTGGIEYIRVSDDGIGMDSQDILLAFQRHATSKIKDTSQLFSINTMGFRGEAVPSIASVSLTTCISNDGNVCNKVVFDNGKLLSNIPFSADKGTTFIVEYLFAKVPARLKYLKNDHYEQALIVNMIQKLALINTNIAFSLITDGNTLFESDGKGNVTNVFFKIYGGNVTSNLLPFKANDFDLNIDGVIAPPSFARSNKNQITISLNGRLIKPGLLTSTILNACKQYFEKGKYPILLLNMQMDSQLVDINVSPNKLEVRISKENQLENLVYNTLNQVLKDNVKFISFSDEQLDRSLYQTTNTPVNYVQPQQTYHFEQQTIYNQPDSYVVASFYNNTTLEQEQSDNSINKQESFEQPLPHIEVTLRPSESIFNCQLENTTNVRLIGQCHGKYILAEDDQGLLIIDQHAAQERVHYEQLRKKMTKDFNQHILLTPILCHTSKDIVKSYNKLNEYSSSLHLQFEPFGEDVLIIRSLPGWAKHILDEQFYLDIIHDLMENKTVQIEDAIHKKIATRACKSSIKFNQYLDKNQMQQVINELFACCDPYACPHGRPIIIRVTDAQLEREFAR